MKVVYKGLKKIIGSLIFIENKHPVKIGEYVTLKYSDGDIRNGQVLSMDEDYVCINVFQGTFETDAIEPELTFTGKQFRIGLSNDMRGKIFDGYGRLRKLLNIGGSDNYIPETFKIVDDRVLNPYGRTNPQDFIQTGISSIDGLNSLVRGQKLPIFTGQGLPHNELIAQIITQAKISDSDKFLIIFCGIGILLEDAMFFVNNLKKSGNFKNTIFFLNLANEPVLERIMIPRLALTTGEYFAFEKDMHVFVIISDITNYCEALRTISNAKQELPARKGFPSYLYSDLASLYERAGKLKDKSGSLTQMPVVSMPDDDITHPIPDLTGYITEGQLVLSRKLHKKGMYPAIDILSSLSRLMKSGVGEGKTREDHADLANQLYAYYAESIELEKLATVIGIEGLSERDRLILNFKELLENYFLNQQEFENRTINDTLKLGWKLISTIPRTEISRVNENFISQYYVNNMNINQLKEY